MSSRIAVVVGDPNLERVLVRVLGERGHDVWPVRFTDPATTRAALSLARPELVVVDSAVPDLAVAPPGGLIVLAREGQAAPPAAEGVETITRPIDVEHFAARVAARVARPAEALAFGRYRRVRVLGRGGQGEVSLAFDARDGGLVALKVPRGPQDARDQVRFMREAYALASVRSPHVVAIRDVGSTGGAPFYAMEFVPGGSLQERVAREGPVTERDARGLLRGLLRALAAVRAAGMLHRDVKPTNVLLRGGAMDAPVLVDFGLARLEMDLGLTEPDLMLGTLDFLPPEQVDRGAFDPRSDLYAAGMTARWALTGASPFADLPPLRAMEAIVAGLEPLPRSVASPGLGQLLAALCDVDPDARPATAEAALEWLDALEA